MGSPYYAIVYAWVFPNLSAAFITQDRTLFHDNELPSSRTMWEIMTVYQRRLGFKGSALEAFLRLTVHSRFMVML